MFIALTSIGAVIGTGLVVLAARYGLLASYAIDAPKETPARLGRDVLIGTAAGTVCGLALAVVIQVESGRRHDILEQARNSQATAERLEQLSESPDEQVRAAVAGNPKTPHRVLIKLSADPDFQVQWAVTSNPALVQALTSNNERIRFKAALACKNLKIVEGGGYPPPVVRKVEAALRQLLKDESPEVRSAAKQALRMD